MSRNTRTTRFVQNTVSTAAYQLTAMLMGFVTPRLMMKYYGSQVNGLIVSATEFLTYFRLVEAGLAAAAVVSLYRPMAKRDDAAISGIVSAARTFYNSAGLLFCGLTLVFSVVYPFFVPVADLNGSPMSRMSVSLLICAMGVSGALEFFTLSKYRVLLTADMRNYVISLVSMLSLLLSTAIIVTMAYLQVDIIIVRLCASLTLLLRSVILAAYTKRVYPNVNAYAPPDKAALSKRWDAMYKQMTDTLHQSAGIMLTTVITRNAALISVYGTYHMVTVGLMGVLKMATTGIYSTFGNLLVTGREKKFQTAYNDFEYLYLSVTSILFSVAAIMIVPFVVLYTDGIQDATYYQPIIGMMIIVEALTDHAKMPMDLMITASGSFREVRFQCTAQLLCAAGLGLGLGLLWGIPGMLLGIILSNLLRTILLMRLVPKTITHLPWQRTLSRILRMFVTVALIAAPFLTVLNLNINGFFKWITLAVPLLLYATAITFGMGWLFDRDTLRSLIGRGLYVLHRKK